MNNLGTIIERAAQPVAHTIDTVLGTTISGCSGCQEMRDNLNAGMRVRDAIYERWFKAKQRGAKVKYQIMVIVDADKTSAAVVKAEAIGEVIGVQVRPTPQPRPTTGQQTEAPPQ